MTGVRVRLLTVGDWALAREMRLEALAESPAAFGSTLEREAALPEEAWRERLAGAWFMAFAPPDHAAPAVAPAEAPAGIASVIQDRDDQGARELVGMWVAPAHRGAGVGDALVRACMDWARADGAARMTLWAVEGNAIARALYARHGLDPTGRTTPLTRRPDLTAMEFVVAL